MQLTTDRDYELLIEQYDAFIYFCLQRCMIDQTWANFDDYAQIARLTLIEASHHTHFDPLSEEVDERRQFMSYARRRIIWKIRDHQRQEQADNEHQINCETTLNQQTVADEALQQVIDQDLIRYLADHLTTQEIELVHILLNDQLNHTQRIESLGISRDTYYRRRHQLQNKLRNLKFLGD